MVSVTPIVQKFGRDIAHVVAALDTDGQVCCCWLLLLLLPPLALFLSGNDLTALLCPRLLLTTVLCCSGAGLGLGLVG